MKWWEELLSNLSWTRELPGPTQICASTNFVMARVCQVLKIFPWKDLFEAFQTNSGKMGVHHNKFEMKTNAINYLLYCKVRRNSTYKMIGILLSSKERSEIAFWSAIFYSLYFEFARSTQIHLTIILPTLIWIFQISHPELSLCGVLAQARISHRVLTFVQDS